MKNMIILALLGLGIGGLIGIIYGKKKAREELRIAISEYKNKNGAWTYTHSGNPVFTDFVLATQCVLGGTNEQSILFTTGTDAEGKALEAGGKYKITGDPIAAKDWSLAAYDPENLIENEAGQYYVSRAMVMTNNQGRWEAYLTPESQMGDNWIHSGKGKGNLILALRIYNATPEVTENLATISLPEITKVN